MKFYWFIQCLLIQCILALTVKADSYYTVSAPGVIKSNRKYSIVVALHEASGPCSIRVAVEGPSFKQSEDVNLQPYESKLIEFLPKKLLPGEYSLKADGLSGLSFKNESKLFANVYDGPKIYIQTDKAIYKPQDLVKFRVVILDEHTRPLNIEDPVNVEILDSESNRVKQFKDISLTNGVYTGQFQLSKYPVLGMWTINVTIGGNYEYWKEKYIKINNYVLPKFSVYLKTPSKVLVEDGNIKVVIYGKYTYDKYVEGNATIELWSEFSQQLLQTKHIDIDNLGFVDFNIKNETANDIIVKAKLTEKHTGITETEEQTIHLQKQRYDLDIPFEEIDFENNIPYRLNVYVKHWTGAPVLDHKTPVIMEHGSKVYEAFLNENGVATFEFEHEKDAGHQLRFKDSKAKLFNIYTSSFLMLNNREFYCRLNLVDKKLKLGKPVEIEVSSIVDIPYLMYTIMGHASLIRTEYIKVPPNQKSHIISITPSIEMIPTSYIYVYYVHKGNLRYDEMRLNFPKEFENQISLSAPKQVKPGEDVTITINTQPKSYVSLLAVDLGVYLLDKSYDLDRNDILDELSSEKSFSPVNSSNYPGLISGLLTFTNAHYPVQYWSSGGGGGHYNPTSLRFRQKFPETWIFDNFWINETTTKLTLPIPDAITTWRLTAFSNNKAIGFGIVDRPTDITTIQSFFISINLPYAVKRGEIVTIPITVFNYLNQNLDTEVVFYNNDQEFYFMESNVERKKKSIDKQQEQVKYITVPANKAKTMNFYIDPIQVGEISLKIAASSSSYSDAVIQKLKVEPEGVPKQKTQSLYLSVPEGEKISSSFNIEEPEDNVPDSNYITFSVGGHYLVPTVENFDNLIEMPTGCGEQNMVNFAPKVLILQYLKANVKFSEDNDLVKSLFAAIEISYQQQLSFRHTNGGFSVFGMATDDESSTWLTAYVVRYFMKASEFLSIEERLIESDLEYLASQQKPTGEFLNTGYLLNPHHKNEYGLTAFILLAFLENDTYAIKYKDNIQNGLEFLNSNLNNINDIYVLSLTATAMKRANHPKAKTLIAQLNSLAKEENGLKWWSGDDHNLADDIEITAYAAINLLDTPGNHIPILRWLIEQRNANGGFTSSYDTVVGMEALVKFSKIYGNFGNTNLKISYSAINLEGIELVNDEFYMDSSNIFDLQKHELPEATRYINFEMEGFGSALVQLNHQYNIVNDNEFQYFIIRPNAKLKNDKDINLEVCFVYQSDSLITNSVTNMVIMEINLPSGFRFETENSMSLKDNKIVQKFETKNSESTIILYLDKLEENNNYCLAVPAEKKSEILMAKPAAILMYDYYNLTRSNTEFYTV